MLESIATTLKHNHQALIFHNRRGTAPTTLCENCGWNALCLVVLCRSPSTPIALRLIVISAACANACRPRALSVARRTYFIKVSGPSLSIKNYPNSSLLLVSHGLMVILTTIILSISTIKHYTTARLTLSSVRKSSPKASTSLAAYGRRRASRCWPGATRLPIE